MPLKLCKSDGTPEWESSISVARYSHVSLQPGDTFLSIFLSLIVCFSLSLPSFLSFIHFSRVFPSQTFPVTARERPRVDGALQEFKTPGWHFLSSDWFPIKKWSHFNSPPQVCQQSSLSFSAPRAARVCLRLQLIIKIHTLIVTSTKNEARLLAACTSP